MVLLLHCLLSSITLWRPSMLTLTARGTLFSPTAERRAEKWTSQSILWFTTISWRHLKSRTSANTKGPEVEGWKLGMVVVRGQSSPLASSSSPGLMMSERTTLSSP